jgi:glutamate dehydrogenase (NAD(P)+)
MGGSLGRREATARGALFVVQRALAAGLVDGLESVAGATVVIQGYGNAGSICADLFTEAGARVIAISDSRGAVKKLDGIDPQAARDHKEARGSVVGLAGSTEISNDELLAMECDILIPAALENQIHRANAAAVRAKLVAEAANGPTTPEADRILSDNGVVLLPDILANAGGVTVSYFEWLQNIENKQWDLEEVNDRLRIYMERAADSVIAQQREINESLPEITETRDDRGLDNVELEPINLRTAAYLHAVKKVAAVAMERGIWP